MELSLRVYADTSVWLSLFFKKDVHHLDALKAFDSVAKEDIIVTTHILCEVLDVLRDKIILQRRLSDPVAIRKETDSYFREFLSSLRDRNVSIIDPELPSSIHFQEVLQIASQIEAPIVCRDKCPICKRPYLFLKTAGPKRDDVHHAVLAYRLGCQLFLTFDHGFYYIPRELFISMEFRILEA
jgi:predicted nucleic acid-binding protein